MNNSRDDLYNIEARVFYQSRVQKDQRKHSEVECGSTQILMSPNHH